MLSEPAPIPHFVRAPAPTRGCLHRVFAPSLRRVDKPLNVKHFPCFKNVAKTR